LFFARKACSVGSVMPSTPSKDTSGFLAFDRSGLAMRASHVLVAVLVVAALAFAAVGAALNDTFFLRLATEALILGGFALSVDILLG
jgi:branched-chain amino acid transport system permease protein